MEEQSLEITVQKLKSAKSKFWFALTFCIFLSVVVIAGIICLLVLTEDQYAPVILAVALAFGWVGEILLIINPAYKDIKELKAQIGASENTENFN